MRGVFGTSWALLAVVIVASLGCGGRTPEQKREDRTILLEIHMGWEYFKVSKKRDPKNIDELAEGMQQGGTGSTQESIGRIRGGAYVVNFGADTSKGPDTILAYEAGAMTGSGYVLTADGTISEMTASSLKGKLGK